MEEILNEKILEVLGYDKEELNCASAEAALGEVFANDHNSDPFTLLRMFICNCSPEELQMLKSYERNA